MSIPSRILSAGNSPLSTISIAGDAATGLVAVGSTQATALQLSAVYNAITTSAASTGVILQPSEAGARVVVYNASGQTISIYPPVSSQINALSANAAYTVATAKTVELIAMSSTQWVTILTA
jgi:hypothetical protein